MDVFKYIYVYLHKYIYVYIYINKSDTITLHDIVLPRTPKLISRLDMLLGSSGMERRAKREQSEAKNENTALGGISAWDAQSDFREVIN